MLNRSVSENGIVSSRGPALLLLLIVVFSLVYFFSNIGADLVRSGEARAAEIAREMLERGNFILPSLNHVVTGQSLTKPPLYHWMLIAISAPIDWPNWAVRLTSVLASLGTLWLTFLCGSRMFGFRAGVYSALVLSTCILFLDNSAAARMDIFFCFLILASVYSFWMAINSDDHVKWTYGFFALSAMGVLTKGPIGILFPLLVAVIFSWNNLDVRSWRELPLGKGVLLFLAVVLPWYVLMYVTAPGSLGFDFLFGQLAHWWAGSSNVTSSGGKPFLYYLPHLLVGFFPWSLLLPIALVLGFRNANKKNDVALKALLVWFLGGLLLFSFGGKKAARYLLPIMPPLALILGFYLDRIRNGISKRHALILNISALLVFLLALGVAVLTAGIITESESVIQWLSKGQRKGGASALQAIITMLQNHPLEAASTVVLMLLAAFFAIWGSVRRYHGVMIFGLAAVIWTMVWPYALSIKPALHDEMSPRKTAEEIARMLPENTVLHGGGKGYQHTMRWYMKKNIQVDFASKLYNRVLNEPDSWVLLMEKKPLRDELQNIKREKLQWQIEYYYVTLFPGLGYRE